MPSKWVLESIKIAMDKEYGYLDKLLNVYPAASVERDFALSSEERERIKELFDEIDNFDKAVDLIIYLLSFDKFPIKYPYVAFLRALKRKKGIQFLRGYLQNNPSLVNNIKEQLKRLGLDGIYDGIEEPKEANRRMGSLFPHWLRRTFRGQFRSRRALINESHHGIYFLEGSDARLLEFAQEVLGYSSSKRPDFVGKVVANNEKQFFFVGEAKFLTDYGGHQDRQLKDALDLLNASFHPSEDVVSAEGVVPIAVLDGVVWITGGRQKSNMLKKILELPDDKIALSVLLLEDFLNCLLEGGDLTRCI